MNAKRLGKIASEADVDLIGTVEVLLDADARQWRGSFKIPQRKYLPLGNYELRLVDGSRGNIIVTSLVNGIFAQFEGIRQFTTGSPTTMSDVDE